MRRHHDDPGSGAAHAANDLEAVAARQIEIEQDDGDRVLREVEYPLLSAALAATRGNQIRAAELLGLNRNTLRSRIKALDLRVFRTPAA